MAKIAPETLAALRFLRSNGASIMVELRASIPGLAAKTMANLMQLGYALRHEGGGFVISPRGRERLRKAEGEALTSTPTRSAAAESNREVEEGVLDELRRSTVRLSLPDLARRTHLSESMVRPTLVLMVRAGTVTTSSGKVPLYSLPRSARTSSRDPYPAENYDGAELRRNPGIQPERFAAFDLPSRVNDRLHWPDGRVTPVTHPRA